MSDVPSGAAGRELILVHGSWMGGWSWDAVGRRLRAQGYEVHAPTLAGLEPSSPATGPRIGLARHAAEIAALVDRLAPARPVIVGHSYGGVVAAEAAAARAGRVAALIVIDGFVVPKGRSIFGWRPDVAEMMAPLIDPERPELIQPPPVDLLIAPGELAPEDTEARLRPMPLATHREEAVAGAGSAACPAAYAHFSRFEMTANEAVAAARLGWTVEAIDAGHLAILTDPDAAAGAIGRAVRAAEAEGAAP